MSFLLLLLLLLFDTSTNTHFTRITHYTRPTNSSTSLCETRIHSHDAILLVVVVVVFSLLFFFFLLLLLIDCMLSFDILVSECKNSSHNNFEHRIFPLFFDANCQCTICALRGLEFIYFSLRLLFSLSRELCTLISFRITRIQKKKQNKNEFRRRMAAQHTERERERGVESAICQNCRIRNCEKLYLVFGIRADMSNGATHDT